MRKLNYKQAQALAQRLGLDIDDDVTTFYATDDEESELFSFDTRDERDNFVAKNAHA